MNGLSAAGKAGVTVDGRNRFSAVPHLPKIYFLYLASTWTDARLTATAYIRRADKTALSEPSPNEPVPSLGNNTVVLDSVALLIRSLHTLALVRARSLNGLTFLL